MSPAARRVAVAAAIALVLGVVNRQILAKERIRRDGTVIFLELRPLDPRSLMQGDYMALRFALADALEERRREGLQGALALGEGGLGLAPIRLDASGVATLAPEGSPGALQVRYRIRGGQVWLGTNAFFFAEGDAARFAPARFGEFRLDRGTGEAVLVGLRDRELNRLDRDEGAQHRP